MYATILRSQRNENNSSWRGGAKRALTILAVAALLGGCDNDTLAPEPEPDIPADDIDILPAVDTLRMGEPVQLTAVVRDSTGAIIDRAVEWESTEPNIVSVDSTGLVTLESEVSLTINVEILATVDHRMTVAAIVVPGSDPTWCERIITAPPPDNLPLYEVSDLTPSGGSSFWPRGLNAVGQVVGVYRSSGRSRAALWVSGHIDLLATPVGLESSAYAINESGDIVGYILDDQCSRAVLWRGGELIDLRGDDAACTAGAAGMVINDEGAVGIYDRSLYLWRDGAIISPDDLGSGAVPLSINNRSEVAVVGAFQVYSNSHVWNFEAGESELVQGLHGRSTIATSINDSSVVVGVSETRPGAGFDLFCSQHGVTTDFRLSLNALSALPYGPATERPQINNQGEILIPGGRLLLSAQPLDLNDLLTDSSWEIVSVADINDNGQIVGMALKDGSDTRTPVLLSPVEAG